LADRFATSDGGEYYVTWGRDGQVLSRSTRAPDVPPPQRPANLMRDPVGPPSPREPHTPQVRQRGDVREAVLFGPFGVNIVVGRSTEPDRRELRRLALLMTTLGGTVLVVGLAGGLVLAGRVIRPIQAITAAAESVDAANLSRRIAVHDSKSELGGLAAVLNNTFGRLEAAFAQQSRFIADASHELRTPLAVMHSSLQLALSRDRSAEEYKKTVLTCQRASTRMKDLIDSLLLLAGADAGRLTLDRRPIALSHIVAGAIDMMTPIAAAKGVTIESHLNDVVIDGDATRIDQVITNLLSNAVRYNREGGRVTVSLTRQDDAALLSVADTGVGISAEHQPHVFDRFYRVDAARSRAEGGSGLGLAIVQSIIVAHGGSIGVSSRAGEGTIFSVRLPAMPTPLTQTSGAAS
jgi:heavy metal sensor kinase